ncbi:MAG: PAS domain S-box protein [Methanocalculus sp.]|uniref:PAS domain-containing sensor histidine kinase n=1 Tax=Methanocalculus sp. TaxID=2004547 RepID=UPI002718B319|nr:PAS domain S-box protein [Methanocalculus sp.]MDO9538660.1 PAS domain S-box protein [Methanocalculus sp.]
MLENRALSNFGKGPHSSLFIRIWVFSALTITAYLITYHAVQNGITDVYPALFFIPILYAALFFPQRETIITVAIAFGYFALVYSLAGDNVSIIYGSAVNFILFISFGLVAAAVSDHVRKRTRRYNGVIARSESCNWIVDRKTKKILDINPHCVSLFDNIPNNLLGRPMHDLWRDQGRADEVLDQIEALTKVNNHEEVLIRQDGTEIHVRLSGSILDDEVMVISAVDITSLKNAELLCQKTEAAYKETLDSMNMPVLVIGRDHRILLYNHSALRSLQMEGRSIHIMGEKIEDIFPFIDFLSDPLQDEEIFTRRHSIRREISCEVRGVPYWYDLLINPIKNRDNAECATVIIHDITERRNVEILWRKSEASHRAIFDNAGAGILILDEHGLITSVNDEFCTLTGYQKDTLKGKHVVSIFHKRDQPIMMACLDSDPAHISHDEYEVKIIDFEGEERDCMLLTAQIPDTSHRVVSLIDITEEQRMIEMIREQEANYQQLITHIPVGIFTCNRGIFTFVNPSFCRITGFPEDELIHEPITKVLPSQNDMVVYNTPKELPFSIKDGCERLGEVEFRVVMSDGEPVDLGILIDISQHKILEESLKDEIERRSDFVTIASHELRTPLQPVIGYLGLLLSDTDHYQLSQEVVDILNLLQKHIDHERRIIDRMIELSIVDSGKISPSFEDIMLQRAVEDIITDHSYRAKAEIINEISPSVIIRADSSLLYHAFNSLISNAVRYNDPPRIISVNYDADEGNHYIRIVDNGVGIESSSLARIFEPFNIADLQKLNRQYDRLGLGLPIAQRYVQIHGGEITVESTPDKGSIFTVRIPMVIVK